MSHYRQILWANSYLDDAIAKLNLAGKSFDLAKKSVDCPEFGRFRVDEFNAATHEARKQLEVLQELVSQHLLGKPKK